MKTPMNCDLHDYLEIACMYKIQVSITLTGGRQYKGTPITTKINAEKEECLEFLPVSSNEQMCIPLYMLETMKALTHNIHFNVVTFIEPH